jgi:hypothetical protein
MALLDVYTAQTFAPSFVIDSYHLNSILLSGTSIAAAPNPGTPFLRTHPLPIADSIGATRVNLVGVDIGENRSIELTKASGIKQIQDVYIVSAQPRTYQSFSISNPNLVAIGAYNIIGQTFVQPTHLTLKQSAITNAKVLGIEKGSTLKLDASTIDTEFVRLDGTLAGNGTIRGAAGAGSSVSFFTRPARFFHRDCQSAHSTLRAVLAFRERHHSYPKSTPTQHRKQTCFPSPGR